TLYGEWLGPAETSGWRGLLTEEDLFAIPFAHYRILATGPVTRAGSHPVYHHEMSAKYYAHLRHHGLPA
nr:hypothetical protein [Opitutaceae bacterium]